jgi:para-aminobenzoate synthetase component 1
LRTHTYFEIKHFDFFKDQLIYWAQQFEEVVWLDSNKHGSKFQQNDGILAVGAEKSLETTTNRAFERLEQFHEDCKDWIFGFLTYDLKNSTEALSSQNFDALHFPDLYFFQPKKLILIKDNKVIFKYLIKHHEEVYTDFNQIKSTDIPGIEVHDAPKIKLRIHKDAYFEKVEAMLAHIHRGDIYEANFCQEFYAEDLQINPVQTFLKLNSISRPPFSTYLRLKDKYLLSASPERFLRKDGQRLISQPIKGTARRSHDPEQDRKLKRELQQNEKERSENIMIVDLVRNDLSHTAKPGSVQVTELCQVYSFMQVHQMISTVEAEIREGTSFAQVIKHAFPMGSMTGAPKISAMKIIEELEETKRGLYSGSVGYVTPDRDFDFNVVIRSILYNATKKYASYSVGSAITAKSIPHNEYEECLLKAKAMKEVLEN